MTRLDEVMVSVTSGEVGPITTGIVYCAVVQECMKVFDYARAGEWTRALGAWCDSQPDLVPYRGQCLIHRSQLEQVSGHWLDAATTVERACRYLTDPPHPAVGLAHYQAAELYRLVGRFDEAHAAYGEAHRHGYQPIPGLALLEMARGDRHAAAATIRRARRETVATPQAPALLAAAAEIFSVTGDLPEARAAADELRALADASSSEVLDALSAQVTGTVRFAEGDADAALGDLRAAATAWQQLHMPYEGARTAVMLGHACAALGDRATAALEHDHARRVFADLGAVPDLARVPAAADEATTARAPRREGPLSEREREVLAEVAAGRTNRQVAEALTISEHTVGRHLENIFAKLGVTSRAAATAAAYERELL
jgi:ATP/maltotriose-dependent transcriptional regulator MalT